MNFLSKTFSGVSKVAFRILPFDDPRKAFPDRSLMSIKPPFGGGRKAVEQTLLRQKRILCLSFGCVVISSALYAARVAIDITGPLTLFSALSTALSLINKKALLSQAKAETGDAHIKTLCAQRYNARRAGVVFMLGASLYTAHLGYDAVGTLMPAYHAFLVALFSIVGVMESYAAFSERAAYLEKEFTFKQWLFAIKRDFSNVLPVARIDEPLT